MDWYHILKFIHVSAAFLWLGGGAALVLLAYLADRARDIDVLLRVVSLVVRIAPVVFMPGSLIVLLTGLGMVWFGQLGWDAWVAFGLGGIAVTAGIGMAVLGPTCEKVAKLTAEGRIPEAVQGARRLISVSKFDYTLQFLIVFAMVVKPGWADIALLGAMAMIGVAAGLWFLAPAADRRQAA